MFDPKVKLKMQFLDENKKKVLLVSLCCCVDVEVVVPLMLLCWLILNIIKSFGIDNQTKKIPSTLTKSSFSH